MTSPRLTLNPQNDGIDHLNVYSHARTQLGQWMSNFARLSPPLEFIPDGKFASIEGYWFWLQTRDGALRGLAGAAAKFQGERSVHRDQDEYLNPSDELFRVRVENAIRVKATSRPDMVSLLRSEQYRDLPLEHYYVTSGIVREGGHRWVLDVWNQIRTPTEIGP